MNNIPVIGQKQKYVELDTNQLRLCRAPKKVLFHYFSVLGKSSVIDSNSFIQIRDIWMLNICLIANSFKVCSQARKRHSKGLKSNLSNCLNIRLFASNILRLSLLRINRFPSISQMNGKRLNHQQGNSFTISSIRFILATLMKCFYSKMRQGIWSRLTEIKANRSKSQKNTRRF